MNEMVLVVDFGGQYNQLIARRVRESHVYSEIVSYKKAFEAIREKQPRGIILTGGPNSVYLPDSPTIGKELFGLGVPAAALAGLWFLYRFGNPFPCVFHKLTGLYCPGCGAGRALSALLHLHLVDAIDYNVFFVMALPLAAYYLLKKYIVLVFHRDPLPIFSTSLRTYNIVMLVILGFWILRNIPVFPFTLLAP